MNMMFRDTSLDFAQKQKETVLRDQQKKLEKELKRRQTLLDTKQKFALKEYYKSEYGVRVSQKVMESLTVSEFEEYLKRRHNDLKVKRAMQVLKGCLLTFIHKRRYKKRLKTRVEAATVIQNWYRDNWAFV